MLEIRSGQSKQTYVMNKMFMKTPQPSASVNSSYLDFNESKSEHLHQFGEIYKTGDTGSLNFIVRSSLYTEKMLVLIIWMKNYRYKLEAFGMLEF